MAGRPHSDTPHSTPLLPALQLELERSGEGGMMLDDGGGYDMMYDDDRLLAGGLPSTGPPGMGRIKR